MWNEPTLKQLEALPELYATEKMPAKDTVIQMHFFLGGSDWYASEYGKEDRLFFGYTILNNDLQNAEWGYVSYDEMRSVCVHGIQVDRDLHWRARRAYEVDKIHAAHKEQRKW